MAFASKAMAALLPVDIAHYLHDAGWTELTAEAGSYFLIFTKNIPGYDAVRLEVPQQPALRDYGHRVHQLLIDLEIVEWRSRFDIYLDLVNLKLKRSTTSMTKLNQILAVEKGIKTRVYAEFTALHQATQKSPLMNGFHKAYQPKEEGGEVYPPESQRVQYLHTDVFAQVKTLLTELFDVTATKDWTNCTAKADIVVDGAPLLTGVPATYLLFLEKQLSDLHTFVEKMAELDNAVEWNADAGSGLHKSGPVATQRTAKVQEPIVLYNATPQHPAQTQLITKDVVVGHWATTKLSGALPPTRKKQLLDRIDKVSAAVKFAREQANMTDIHERKVGEGLLRYIFTAE